MKILLGFLTVIMVLDCILMVFLILIQLPKKEAGAGIAFGGAATDALFGAGSGNVLTKITKYVAGIFFGLAVLMALVTANLTRTPGSELIEAVSQQPGGASAPATAPSSNSLLPSSLLSNVPQAKSSGPQAPSSGQEPPATNATGVPNLLTLPPPAATTNK